MSKLYATNIEWDLDGEEVELPTEIEIPEDIIDEANGDEEELADLASDYISDETGWCHLGFELEWEDE